MADIIWHDDDIGTMPAGVRLVLVELSRPRGFVLLCEVFSGGLYDLAGGDEVSQREVVRWAVVRGAE